MDKLLSVSEASTTIGVSADTIRRWNKKGLIKATRSELNYRLFSLVEIKRVHHKVIGGAGQKNHYRILKSKIRTNYTVIDLFAGAGGTALGLHNAGLNHVLLNENDERAVATLCTNMPKWNVVAGNIQNVDFRPYKGKVDIVEGGFPCQSFSYAGKKLGFDDIRGTLFYEFARCVKEVRPKIAIGENVKGLLRHDNGKTLATMISVLDKMGYNARYKVLRSQYLDVPQKRERLVIIAVRKDLDLPILYPKEKDYTVSLREAFENCPKEPGQQYSPMKKHVLSLVPPGGYWRDLPIELQKRYMGASYYLGGGKTGMARRLSWDEPSLTLTCSPAQKQTERCHPQETRPLTVREYARIQTFPDNWKFQGSLASQYKQIGNAVPTNLGYHLGKCVIAMLEKKPNPKTMELVS